MRSPRKGGITTRLASRRRAYEHAACEDLPVLSRSSISSNRKRIMATCAGDSPYPCYKVLAEYDPTDGHVFKEVVGFKMSAVLKRLHRPLVSNEVWSLLHQSLVYLIGLRIEDFFLQMPPIKLHNLVLTLDGDIYLVGVNAETAMKMKSFYEPSVPSAGAAKADPLAKVLKELGLLLFRASDYGLPAERDGVLTGSTESLLTSLIENEKKPVMSLCKLLEICSVRSKIRPPFPFQTYRQMTTSLATAAQQMYDLEKKSGMHADHGPAAVKQDIARMRSLMDKVHRDSVNDLSETCVTAAAGISLEGDLENAKVLYHDPDRHYPSVVVTVAENEEVHSQLCREALEREELKLSLRETEDSVSLIQELVRRVILEELQQQQQKQPTSTEGAKGGASKLAPPEPKGQSKSCIDLSGQGGASAPGSLTSSLKSSPLNLSNSCHDISKMQSHELLTLNELKAIRKAVTDGLLETIQRFDLRLFTYFVNNRICFTCKTKLKSRLWFSKHYYTCVICDKKICEQCCTATTDLRHIAERYPELKNENVFICLFCLAFVTFQK